MKQYNCKNCGAPLEHSYNHKCPYCNSLFDFNEPKENTIEAKPEDLINIELRQVERAFITDNLILVFSGFKCEMPKVYECNNNAYVSKVETYINPPKCSFCIELPLCDIQRYGYDYVMWRIRATGVRYNELENIERQIREKIWKFI